MKRVYAIVLVAAGLALLRGQRPSPTMEERPTGRPPQQQHVEVPTGPSMRRRGAVVLIAAGLALLGWQVLRPMVEERQIESAQQQLVAEIPAGPASGAGLTQAGGSAAPRQSVPVARYARVGEALALMRVPRFGDDWEWAAVQGTALKEINLGPGHYPRTPLPGAVGNVAFAAHRAGHGDPFIDFDLLRPGDEVLFEQGDVQWVYEIDTEPVIVPVTASWVLAPFGSAGDRDLTLTTCWPKYGSSKRMYVRGHLEQVTVTEDSGSPRIVWSEAADQTS